MNITGSNNKLSGNIGLGTSGTHNGDPGMGTYSGTGALNVSGTSNEITGNLFVLTGAVTVSGSDAELNVIGAMTFPNFSDSGQFLSVQDGATFTASGSVALAFGDVAASSGGTLNLPTLTSISGADNLQFGATGTKSEIALPNLTSFSGGYDDGISETSGAAVVLSTALTSLDGVTVTVDGTGTLPLDQFTSLTDGGLTVEGGSYPLTNLTKIANSTFQVEGGGSLDLPAVTSDSEGSSASYGGATFDAGEYNISGNYVSAGVISLPSLASIHAPYLNFDFTVIGTQSQINLPELTSFNGGSLTVTEDGAFFDPTLTTVNGVGVVLDGTGTIQTDLWQSLTNGSLVLEGGDYSSTTSPPFASLADIDGSSIYVEDGGSLALPAVIAYANPNDYAFESPLSASGADTTLSLPNLTTVDVSAFDTGVAFEALQGGQVILPLLTTINISSEASGELGMIFQSDGSGSLLDVSSLTNISGGAAGASLTITDGGAVDDPNLTTFSNVTITTDSTGIFAVPADETFTFPSGVTSISTGILLAQGGVSVQGSATLKVEGGLTLNGQGALSLASGSTLDVSGNLLGNTTNASGFSAAGTLVFDGGGTSSSPQLMEAMSQDMGNIGAGFNQNFAYGTLKLTANTYVELVDDAANSPGNTPEAVYVNSLIVPAGATLNLNGLHVYAQSTQISGKIVGGTVSLSTVEWISTASGDWNVGSNWSTGTVPGSNDTVIIDVPGASPTITISSGTHSVLSISASDPLSITGGSLIVAASSTIGGGLSMTGGTLEATGAGVPLTVTGTTTVSGANFYAQNGATLNVPNLVSYTGGQNYPTTLQASGTGSVLNLPDLTTWEGEFGGGNSAQVSALSGGEILMAALTTDKGGITHILAQGTGSIVDLPELTNLISDQVYDSTLQATQGGRIESPSLTSLSKVTLTIDGTGIQDTAQITSVVGSNIYVSGGTTVTLSSLTQYTGGLNTSTTLEASGPGTVLNLPSLTTWEGEYDGGNIAQVSALSGGEISFATLTTDEGGITDILSQGTGSIVDLPELTNLISDQVYDSTLQATQGGRIESPSLTSLSKVTLTIDSTGIQDTAQITSVVGSNIYVSGGTTVTLSSLTQYTGGLNTSTTLEASGPGTVLNLPNLTTWEGEYDGGNIAQVSALSGGEISFATLTTDEGGITDILSQGTGSIVDLPELTNLISDQVYDSTLQATQGGRIESPSLTSLSKVTLTIDGTGIQDTAQITSVVGSNIYVSGGTTVTLSSLTQYTGGLNTSTTLEASGPGTVLNLPSLTTWEGEYDGGNIAQVSALSGGEISFATLTTDEGGITDILSQGTGSIVDLPELTNLISDQVYDSTLQATQGGRIESPSLTSLSKVTLTIDGTGIQDTAQITSVVGSNIYVSGGTAVTLSSLTQYSGGLNTSTTLEASGSGTVLNLPNLTTWEGEYDGGNIAQVSALSGGEISFAALTTDKGGITHILAQGTSSIVDLPELTNLISDQAYDSTLQTTQGGVVIDPNLVTFADVTITTDSTGTLTVPADQTFYFPSSQTTIDTGTLYDQGTLNVSSKAILSIEAGLTINGQGALSSSSNSTLEVSGNLLGNTTNAAAFNPAGTVVLDGSGTSGAPQLLEAMSQDLGNVAAGFDDNFAYNTLKLTNNTYVELVDDSANSPGGTPDAVYVNTLIVPAGTTLNLNGLHLYAQTEQVSGTITGGSVSPPTVEWISTASGNWNVGSNWSTGTVPNSNDDVIIDVPGATPTVTISSGTDSVLSITASDPVSMTGGSLIVAANSTIGGGLSMTGGTLEANGTGAFLKVTGTTTISGASLFAEGGAQLTLPGLSSYQDPNNSSPTLQASGTGSLLSLPNITSISPTNADAAINVQALSGGDVEIPLVTQINGDVILAANSATSILNISGLTTFTGGTLEYSGGTLNASGTTPNLPALTDIDQSTLIVSGGATLAPSTVTSARGSSLEANGGARLTLSGLTSYQDPYNSVPALEASGDGSLLSLTNITSISPTSADAEIDVEALDGGDVEIPLVTQINGAVLLDANSATSILNISGLTTFTGGTLEYSGGTLNASGATPSLPALTDIDQSTLIVSGGATLAPSTVTSARGSSLEVNGGARLTLSGLTSYQDPYNSVPALEASGDGSLLSLTNITSISPTSADAEIDVEALDGGDLEIPLVTQINGAVFLNANSATSVLNISGLTTFTGGTLEYSGGTLNASGATPNLPALTDIDQSTLIVSGGATLAPSTVTSARGSSLDASGGANLTLAGLTSYQDPYNSIPTLQASGAGSLLSLPNITSISPTSADAEIDVEALAGGDLEIPLVTQINGAVFLEANSATSILDISGLTTFTDGTLEYSGGTLNASGATPNLPALTDIDQSTLIVSGGATLAPSTVTSARGSSLEASGGAKLTLAGLTSYQDPYNSIPTLQASGAGSLLSLPKITSISPTNADAAINVEALSSGDVEIPLVTQISGAVSLKSSGTGSVLDLSALAEFNGGSLTVTNSGAVTTPSLATLISVTVTTDRTGTFTLLANQTFTLPSGTTTISTGTFLAQGNADVQGSAVLKVEGGVTFNGQGSLSLSSGSTIDVSGNLVGSTTNAADFNVSGTVVLDGSDTGSSPQLIEAMSQDLGNIAAGFDDNFAYGTLKLTANTYAELVDNAANSPGGTPEAVYVNTLIVPAGATLNLNGLHLYAQTAEVSGTITGGSVSPPTVEWVSTANGNWNVGGNWSTGTVPGSNDDVIIDVPGASPIVTISSGTDSVLSITASDPLSITGGSLIVAGNSTIGGGLSITGGTLEANGAGISLTVSGTTMVSGASLYAEAGATLSLPQLISYIGGANYSSTIEATGTSGSGSPSEVSMSSLTTLTGGSGFGITSIDAMAGGVVSLPALTSVPEGDISIYANGTGSTVSVPVLASISYNPSYGTYYNSTINSSNAAGGTIVDPLLTSLTQTNVTIDGTGTIATGQIATIIGGTLTVSGGPAQSLSALTDANGSNLYAYNGVVLSLPELTSYVGGANSDTYIEASGTSGSNGTGTASQIFFPALTTLTGGSGYGVTAITALASGIVSLPALISVPEGIISLDANGAGSSVSVPVLASIASNAAYGTYIDSTINNSDAAGGAIVDPLLTTLSRTDITLDANSTLSTAQITSDASGTITINGGSPSFSGLTSMVASTLTVNSGSPLFANLATITESSIYANNGVVLTLPAVTSYVGGANFDTTIEASGTSGPNGTGTPSQISVLGLTTLTGANGFGVTAIDAMTGGIVSLPALTSVPAGDISLHANGAGSTVSVPVLASIASNPSYPTYNNSTIDSSDAAGGTIFDPLLTSLSRTNLNMDGSGTITTNQIMTFTAGTLTVSGGVNLTMPALTNIDDSDFLVGGGAKLTLSIVTQYNGGTGDTDTLQATGSGSELSLPKLASIIGEPNYLYSWTQAEALAGGDVELPVLTQITGGPVLVESDGSGSLLDVPQLASFTGEAGRVNFSTLQDTDGASVIDPSLATLNTVNLVTSATAALTLPQSQTFSFTGGSNTVETGTLLDEGDLNVENTTTVNVQGGLTINGQGSLAIGTSGTLDVSGNLLGNTTNAAGFNDLGTVVFDGDGTASSPQLVEVMSQDLGNVTAGFNDNFAYGILDLTANTYAELVDNASNSPGDLPEALYVNDLIVPSGATLNLDGLHLYAETEQIDGTLISGGAVVSGEVYDDANDSGTLSSGDPGLAGWTIELTNTATSARYTTTTGTNGLYSVSGVAVGTYTLSEVVQQGFSETQPVSPGTYSLTLSSGQTVTNENFGDYPTGAIGGEVFLDTNGDGTLESGESGLGGWTVELLNTSNAVIAMATTGSDGDYSFASLLPGTYTVQVTSQSGYVASSPASVMVTYDNGQRDTVNFGEFVPVAIGGEVFDDPTNSGQFSTGDTGLSGWTVELVQGSQVMQATTGSGGAYSFSNVGPGSWTLEVVQQTAWAATNSPVTVTPTSGTNISGVDLGKRQIVNIGGEVFNDLSDSGVFNSNDPGLPHWTVRLLNSSNQIIASDTTDANGNYLFTNLATGIYTVEDVLQAGYIQTTPASGSFAIVAPNGGQFTGENFGVYQAQQGPPVYQVTSIADSGVGSFREAIDYADAYGGAITIDFAIGTGQQTIDVLSALPAIIAAVTIDGTTQPGYTDRPLIELDGAGAGAGTNGLTITGNDITVKGLIIERVRRRRDRSYRQRRSRREQLLSAQISPGSKPWATAQAGIAIIGGATANTIGGMTAGSGNVISANAGDGVDDIDANSNVIVGNWIGTNAGGTAALANGGDGIFVGGSSSVIIGGTALGAGNLISGNATNGIEIDDSTGTLIQGNLIGLDQTGTLALGNRGAGVLIDDGSVSNTIGAPVAGGRNFISGNAEGVLITGSSTAGTDVAGNLIGTNFEGTAAVGNLTAGIVIAGGTGATIGAADAPAGNVISGNTGDGIDIGGGAANTLVHGNYIGTDQTGTKPLGNSGSGVSVDDAAGVTIGGAAQGVGNVISANAHAGVSIAGTATTGVVILGNLIGTDETGTAALGNGTFGVLVSGTPGVTIGGTATGDGNIISANPTAGIGLYADTTGALVQKQPDRHRHHRLDPARQRQRHPDRRRLFQ